MQPDSHRFVTTDVPAAGDLDTILECGSWSGSPVFFGAVEAWFELALPEEPCKTQWQLATSAVCFAMQALPQCYALPDCLGLFQLSGTDGISR